MIEQELAVCDGLGVDSMAMLVGFQQRGIKPKIVIFADVGSEKEPTYEYIPVLNRWLEKVWGLKLTIAKYTPKNFKYWPPYHSLEENILTNSTLPSIAYGGHTCSSKWKIQAINKHIKELEWAQRYWAGGFKIRKAIGFENSPHELKRSAKGCATFNVNADEADKYDLFFPLQEWGWNRDRCKVEIIGAGLPVPMKSSCYFCLGGETEVLTRQGLKPIRDLVGKTELLVPLANGYYKDGTHGKRELRSCGTWKECEVSEFGEEDFFEVKLRRWQSEKTIRCTGEHRWILEDGSRRRTYELAPGNIIAGCRVMPMECSQHQIKLSAFAAAQGFCFGDGTQGMGDRPGFVVFHGEKKDMLPWFSSCSQLPTKLPTGEVALRANDIPRTWKDLPNLAESKSFLLGWLAGYFAADGCMDAKCAASLESSSTQAVQCVRDICHLLGVRCGPVLPVTKEAFGKEWMHWRLSINASDLPDNFWIRKKHQKYLKNHEFKKSIRREWKVVGIRTLPEKGLVYCAKVPEVYAFTLADEILTGNCTAMKPWEVNELSQDKMRRIVVIEARAAKRNLDFSEKRANENGLEWNGKPLWRKAVKGMRGAIPKPGSMTQYIREKGLLPGEVIDQIIAATPTQSFTQTDFEKMGFNNWQEWLSSVCYPEKS